MTRYHSLSYYTDPTHYFFCLKHLKGFVWLDSGRPKSQQGRYDIFTALPTSEARINAEGKLILDGDDKAGSSIESWIAHHTNNETQSNSEKKSAFEQDVLADTPQKKLLPFTGGVIGYFGYSWQNPHFQLKPSHSYSFPITHLRAHNWAIIVDHQTKQCTGVFQTGSPEAIIKSLIGDGVGTPVPAPSAAEPFSQAQANFTCGPFTQTSSKGQYFEAIDRIHEYILAGDTYQINFSQHFKAPYQGCLDQAYLQLRNASPSPYAAYFKSDETHILSASPERFLSCRDGSVTTQPIKGSSPRGQTPEHDEQLKQDLLNSAKNRAENIMIVDLLRNDLSQCCEPFSVTTPDICSLHTFANVHHLISTVEGELKPEYTAFDLFKRSFPGGSITGAPKKRSMEIIELLEPHDRGVYCGSMAYFSNNGNHDSNIAIRTLQSTDNALHCWGGGGIVMDSTAEEEYDESLFKVQKLMDCLQNIESTLNKPL